MLAGLTWLLVYQCIGEILVHWTGLPVPGPVVGMVLLFVTLVVRKGASEGDLVEVTGNLRAGDRVVRRATDEMREGAALP